MRSDRNRRRIGGHALIDPPAPFIACLWFAQALQPAAAVRAEHRSGHQGPLPHHGSRRLDQTRRPDSMITWLLDGNILIAMALVDHPHRGRCLRWFAGISSFATCPVTEGALQRVHMQHAAAKSAAAAWRTLGAYRAHPKHVFCPDGISCLTRWQDRPKFARMNRLSREIPYRVAFAHDMPPVAYPQQMPQVAEQHCRQ